MQKNKKITIEDLKPKDRKTGYPLDVPRWYTKLFEFIPGFFTWTIMLSPIVASILEITEVIVIYVSFLTIYWSFRGMRFAAGLIIGYNRMKRDVARDWVGDIEEIDKPLPYYMVLCPFVREGIETVQPTIQAWADQDIGSKRISIVFALEERCSDESLKTVETIKKKYKNTFREILTYVHPNDIEGEVMGVKGANINWATRHFVKEIEGRGEKAEDYLVMSCDIDRRPESKYLSAVTYKYLTVDSPKKKFYCTAVHTYQNNIWRVPVLVRAFSMTLTLVILHNWVVHPERRDTWSEFIVNLDSVKKIGYWDPEVGIDDTPFYWNARIRFNGDFRGEEVYIPHHNDAVENATRLETYKALYKQQLRWGWGIIVFPITFAGLYKNKKIPLKKKLHMLYTLLDNQLLFLTVIYMITFALPIVGFISSDYNYSSASYNLPRIMSYILTGVMLLNLPVFFVRRKLIKVPKGWGILRNLQDVIETFMVTINMLTFGFIPKVHAQTEMMLGKTFRKVYYATEKVAIKKSK